MDVEELRRVVQPFMDECVVYVRMGEKYYPIIGSSYMHDEDGHLVLVVGEEEIGR